MDLRSSKSKAFQSLTHAAYSPTRIAAIHTGVTTLASILLSLIGYFLNQGLSSATGLAGMGMRSFLATVEYVLSMSCSLLLPFWGFGFLFVALNFAREQKVSPGFLLEGFRRFFPVMRLLILEALIYLGLAFASANIATILFSVTPLSAALEEPLQILSQSPGLSEEQTLALLAPVIGKVSLVALALFAIVAIPLYYKLRLASFAIMDDAPGARAALAISAQSTKGNRWSLFLVDLQFWWYYGIQLLIGLLAYAADILYFIAGINILGNTAVIVLYAISLVLQFLFFRQYGSYLNTTYAHCYLTLRGNTPPQDPPSDGPVPKN